MQIKLLVLGSIAITGIFIMNLFLFSDQQILNIQKVNAQYSQDNNNSNNNSINNNDKKINFTKSFNLTNNTRDSVYPRVSAFGNNVYVVWQESVPPNGSSKLKVNSNNISSSNSSLKNEPNYDIFIRKSNDGGDTFGKEINLSNNSGFSEHPHLAVYGNNVYTIWIDNNITTSKNKEVFFRKSNDGGKTFSNIINLDKYNMFNNNNKSDDSFGNSINAEISAFENNVYVVWNKEPQSQVNYSDNKNKILFRTSDDGGSTFKNTKTLSNNVSSLTYPKITASPSTNNISKNVYVIWNVGLPNKDLYRNSDGIFFIKSEDNGDNFSNLIKINGPIKSIGKPQIISYKNNIHVVWSGIPDFRINNNLFYTKSNNNGHSFTNPISIDNDKSLAVEVSANKDNLYISWEKIVSESNDDIFIRLSNNEGQNFTKDIINLSNNHGISECPSIALLENKAFFVWEDSSPGNHDIFFMKTLIT